MKSLVLWAALAAMLMGCGSAPQPAFPSAGTAIPVTYYPTPTRNAPAVAELRSAVAAVAAAPTLAPSPTPLPAPTEAPLPAPTDAPALLLPTETPVVLVTLPPAPTAAPLPTETPAPLPTAIPIPPTATAVPMAAAMNTGCTPSGEQYELVPYDGPAYKNNAISDENADLRLSVMGYAPAAGPLSLVDYNGDTDGNAPKISGVFEPNRIPAIAQIYQHFDWRWDEGGGPPYGARGGMNAQWPASVIDVAAAPGERLHIPRRSPVIWNNGIVAMVLYAGERELTIAYTRQDAVGEGYVFHMMNFCVDPGLVAQYRAQVQGGRRATGLLPGVRNGQTVGYSIGNSVTVAIRDRAAFLDPRSRKDWW
jgi:hypothetical protein